MQQKITTTRPTDVVGHLAHLSAAFSAKPRDDGYWEFEFDKSITLPIYMVENPTIITGTYVQFSQTADGDLLVELTAQGRDKFNTIPRTVSDGDAWGILITDLVAQGWYQLGGKFGRIKEGSTSMRWAPSADWKLNDLYAGACKFEVEGC